MLKDLTNKKFGQLTVVERCSYNKNSNAMWVCKCSCGATIDVRGANLISGHTQSCGCLREAATRERMTKHGLRHHPLYTVWTDIKYRVYNSNSTGYKNYGGRGISIG